METWPIDRLLFRCFVLAAMCAAGKDEWAGAELDRMAPIMRSRKNDIEEFRQRWMSMKEQKVNR